MSLVRVLREQAGISQRQLAESAGTSQPAVADYESGRRSPTWRTLARIARAAGSEAVVSFVPPLTREDRRSLALHEEIARRLTSDPGLVHPAERVLERMQRANPKAEPLLSTWKAILALPVPLICVILRDASPIARELRHVTPFAGILSASERAALYAGFRENERRSA